MRNDSIHQWSSSLGQKLAVACGKQTGTVFKAKAHLIPRRLQAFIRFWDRTLSWVQALSTRCQMIKVLVLKMLFHAGSASSEETKNGRRKQSNEAKISTGIEHRKTWTLVWWLAGFDASGYHFPTELTRWTRINKAWGDISGLTSHMWIPGKL